MKKISNKKKYTDATSGEKYSQVDINRNLTKAKGELLEAQRNEWGWSFCEKCKELSEKGWRVPDELKYKTITCAHIKSVKKCKEDGEIEKIWDVDNMIPECLHHHGIRDGLI